MIQHEKLMVSWVNESGTYYSDRRLSDNIVLIIILRMLLNPTDHQEPN